MRIRLAFATLLVVAACGDGPHNAREREVSGVIAQADEVLIRTRPALVAGKYVRMAGSSVDFLRGSLQLYRHDARTGATAVSVSRFALDVPLVPSVGDPHVENFGTLRASDGTLAIEPNDFDAADRAPYLWDVRRLASSMALTALVANSDDPAARDRSALAARAIARATVAGYRTAIEQAASGSPAERVTADSTPAMTNPIMSDVFERSERDEASRRELTNLTELAGPSRRLRRGPVDPEDDQNVFAELPPMAQASLPSAIERWRRTLLVAPPAEHLIVLDAVRQLGSGVASWPRVRVILLVRGATDDPGDDRLLELKELADSGIAGLYPPGIHHDDVGLRVLETSRSAWARPDAEPLWGVTDWLGLRCQIRAETDGHKNIRISRLEGALGTPEAIAELGRVLGSIVARVHVGADRTNTARAIDARIAIDPEGFLDEQADVAVDYARLTRADHKRFRRALERQGLTLGVPIDRADAARLDFAAVLGTPPPPASLD